MENNARNSVHSTNNINVQWNASSQATYGSFPARNVMRLNPESGAWLTAYRREQVRRFNAVLSSNTSDQDVMEMQAKLTKSYLKSITRGKKSSIAEDESFQCLSSQIIVEECGVNLDSDIASINLTGKRLTNPVVEEDFKAFKHVFRIQASDNAFSIEAFNSFPALEELELEVNGISRLNISRNMFLHLKVLDLSFNTIDHMELPSLGFLRCLEKLMLTGNGLEQLSKDFSLPFVSRDSSDAVENLRFSNLKELHLDENNFSDPSVFLVLAWLTRLKVLNLSKNKLSCIPPLLNLKRPREDLKSQSPMVRISTGAEDKTDVSDSRSTTFDIDKISIHDNTNTSNLFEKVNAIGSILEEEEVEELEGIQINLENTEIPKNVTDESPRDKEASVSMERDALYDNSNRLLMGLSTEGYHLNPSIAFAKPFPKLEILDISQNAFSDEEAVLAVSACPMLLEISIWGNPITESIGGEPPLLRKHLKQIFGIDIKRKRPSSKTERLPVAPIITPLARVNKVKDVLPPIRKPNQLMLEFQKKELQWMEEFSNATGQTATLDSKGELKAHEYPNQSTKSGNRNTRISSENSNGVSKSASEQCQEKHKGNDTGVFLTQVDDETFSSDDKNCTTERHVRLDTKSPTSPLARERKIEAPQSPFCVADILAVRDDFEDDTPLPTTIRGSVVALKHALDHPLIFSNGDLEDKLPVYFEKGKTTNKVVQPLASLQEGKIKRAQLVSALDRMRTESHLVEANLGSVMEKYDESPKLRKEFPHVKNLVKRIQVRYDQVRAASLGEITDLRKQATSAKRKIKEQHNIYTRNRERSEPRSRKGTGENRLLMLEKIGNAQPSSEEAEAENKLQDIKSRVDKRI